MLAVDDTDLTRLEAAAFRRLVTHLQERTDVQNIDLMTLAGFCRNCLSNWLEDAARDAGLPVSKAEARQHVYGMPAEAWKARYQHEASDAQRHAFSRAAGHGDPGEAQPGSDACPPASRQAET